MGLEGALVGSSRQRGRGSRGRGFVARGRGRGFGGRGIGRGTRGTGCGEASGQQVRKPNIGYRGGKIHYPATSREALRKAGAGGANKTSTEQKRSLPKKVLAAELDLSTMKNSKNQEQPQVFDGFRGNTMFNSQPKKGPAGITNKGEKSPKPKRKKANKLKRPASSEGTDPGSNNTGKRSRKSSEK